MIISASRSNPPDSEGTQHIMDWCRNSAPHNDRLIGLHKYPRTANFASSAAGMAFTLASEVYRTMRKLGECDDYSPQDILGASILMLDWEGEGI